MSVSKLNTQISIVTATPQKDHEGFAVKSDTVLATVRAAKEERVGSEQQSNAATFSAKSAVFKFRRIPNLRVDTTHSLESIQQ